MSDILPALSRLIYIKITRNRQSGLSILDPTKLANNTECKLFEHNKVIDIPCIKLEKIDRQSQAFYVNNALPSNETGVQLLNK